MVIIGAIASIATFIVSVLALWVSFRSHGQMLKALDHQQAYTETHGLLNRLDSLSRMAYERPLGVSDLENLETDEIRSGWEVVVGKTHDGWRFTPNAIRNIKPHLADLIDAAYSDDEHWKHRQGRAAEALRALVRDARGEVNRQWGSRSKNRPNRRK